MYVFKNVLVSLALSVVSVQAVDFQKDIKPILEKRCVSCHGEKKDKGDLRLHTHKELQKSKVVVAGQAAKSSLYELITLPQDHDDIMPPKGDPLTKNETAKIKEWINTGAKWPANVTLQDRSKEPALPESKMMAKTEAFKKLVPIINKYCVDCHNADKQKGDFRIDNMDQDLVYGIHAQRWHEVLDILNLGEMPPKKSKQLTDTERKDLISTLTGELHKAKEVRKGQVNTVMRRLNNEQYNNTLRDLLGIDFNFAKDLPEDAFSPEGFKNNGETLDMSTLQMEYYMIIARKALGKAIKTTKPEVMKFHVDFGQNKYPKINEGITMGPGGRLIPTTAYKITAPIPERSYPYTHVKLREEFVYNEGYKGNGTVKGDKTFKGLHYAVYPELTPSHKDKIVKEGLVLSPRGDIPIGRGGAKGPSNHMRLVLRDFPREGPVTIKVMASKSPNSLISSYVGKEPITQQVFISNIETKATYPPKSNLQKPEFIITDELNIDKTGYYQLDAQLDSEIDGPVNIHIGKTLLEGVRIKKGATNLVVPIAITKLVSGKAPIKITSKKKPEFALFALTAIKETSGEAKNLDKATRKNKDIAMLYNKRAKAKFSTKENAFEKSSLSQKVTAPRPVKEGEYHIPQPTNFTIKRAFEISESGLYQMDLKLVSELKSGLDITVNNSVLKNLKFKFKSTGNYSTALVELSRGSNLLELLSKEDIPITDISLTKVQNKNTEDLFTAYQSEQYGYLRAFIGNRRDDGQEFLPTKDIFKVDAPLHKPQLIEFNIQMDDFPLPAHDPKNKNYLANLLHVGLWNTPWNQQKNTDIVIHSIEFESNASKTWPPKTHKDIFIDSNKGNEKQYARAILANFLPKAYRKDISDDELNRHLSFFEAFRPHHMSFEKTIKEVLAISLSSPQFLYISEPDGTSRKQLTEHELASRLSYFLWDTMPDSKLMAAAKNKTLKKNLKQHLSRMIQDPRSFNMSKNFSSQWLDIERLERVVVDKKHSGGYNLDVKTSFKNETYNFFHHVLTSNRSIMEFIDSDYAVLDWRLANFYGLPPVRSLNFKAVPVKKDQRRGGVLTHGGILTALSTGKHSSPIKRGVWIAKKIVDSPPPKPPPNVPELDEENPELAKLTRKAQLEKHRDNASCRDCHMKIDPWGIPFEHYDTTGRIKKKGSHFAADTEFADGTKVDGLQELKNYLVTDKKDLVTRSLVKYLGSYAIGRSLSFVDEDEVKKIMAEAKENDYKLQTIIELIVKSDLFQKF